MGQWLIWNDVLQPFCDILNLGDI